MDSSVTGSISRPAGNEKRPPTPQTGTDKIPENEIGKKNLGAFPPQAGTQVAWASSIFVSA
jgi:hypothetical protein